MTSQDASRNSGRVTLTRPDQTRTDQTRPDQTNTNPGCALVVAGSALPPDKPEQISSHDINASLAYAHWRKQHERAPEGLDRKSRGYRHAVKQLKAGRSLDDLLAAIDGCHASDWNRENHKDSFEFIMREDQFQSFMERGYAPRKAKGWVATTQQFLDEQLADLGGAHAG